jgi:hypothetical protein
METDVFFTSIIFLKEIQNGSQILFPKNSTFILEHIIKNKTSTTYDFRTRVPLYICIKGVISG